MNGLMRISEDDQLGQLEAQIQHRRLTNAQRAAGGERGAQSGGSGDLNPKPQIQEAN